MKKMIEKAIKMRVWLILAIAAFSITSCLKDDNNYSVQAAGVALINAAPGSGPLDFYSETSPNILAKPFAYDTVLTYRSAYPGFRVFGVTLHNSREILASQQFSLAPGAAYSLFVTDTANQMKLVMLKDTLSNMDTTRAAIRFANMSADAPKLSLELSGGQTLSLKDMAYSKATDFTAATPSDSYTLKLINSESKKVLATKSGVKLEKGHVYTVWARGIFESTDSKLKLGLNLMEN